MVLCAVASTLRCCWGLVVCLCSIKGRAQIDQWCDDPNWRVLTGKVPRRWLSTNHLLGRGYWIWIIPLASGATSFGIVADPRLHPLSEFNQLDSAIAWLARRDVLQWQDSAVTLARDTAETVEALGRELVQLLAHLLASAQGRDAGR